jgi:hypothetical protein
MSSIAYLGELTVMVWGMTDGNLSKVSISSSSFYEYYYDLQDSSYTFTAEFYITVLSFSFAA